MPELPEVETMCRGIHGIVGAQVLDAQRIPCPRKPILIRPRIDRFRQRVKKCHVESITRAGKRVVIWLDSDDAIVLEPRMTGLVLVADPPTAEHLRWQMDLAGAVHDSLWYWDRRGLGSVRLFSKNEFAAEFESGKLGPDALMVTVDQLRQRLGQSKREIKVALLDQKAVAGIGNLYAAEILHLAGVHPERRCDLMTMQQWKAVADATREVLEIAIRYEGSTLGDGTYRNALNKQGGYQNEHRVYAREGELCPTCGVGTIGRIVQAQRATFFCPICQTKRGTR